MRKFRLLILLAAAMSTAMAQQPVNPVYESAAALHPQNKIDQAVFSEWKRAGIEPARLCSDAVFLRRAYLDGIGTLPTDAEAKAFLESKAPNKRAELIDSLLDREEFADYWAMHWSDVLRIKAEFPINLWPNAAQGYHHWIHDQIHRNRPYDQMVREILTSSGSDFRVAPVNFYRAVQNKDPGTLAQTVALTWMGTRAESWPPEKLAAMSVFFAHIGYKPTEEWKEEIVFFDPTGESGGVKRTAAQLAAMSLPRTATFPDGSTVLLAADDDPRIAFADWLTSPKNPWFTRAIASRVWFWLMGEPLFADPNESGPAAKPVNAELLKALEEDLIDSHYDLKHLYRTILTSEVYQLSSLPQGDRSRASAHFAAYPIRRLDAEVLIDALCQLTGTSEQYSSSVPEPYTYMPDGQRAISLPDGSISSAFLEQFGKPTRDTGLLTERVNTPTDGQRLHMLNSSHVMRKLQQAQALNDLQKNAKSNDEIVSGLYRMILSRYPSTEERAIAVKRLASGGKHDSMVDLAWALINSTEFLYRH